MLTTAVLTIGAAIIATAPAQAGVADGTLNSTRILTDIDLLNAAIDSDSQSTVNTNANVRADGLLNHATGQHQ
ncbi:hypothetical protein [Streptomyces sp. ISL-11]|uniref:hypothetical protein n=1 Tax=Streptomyces sp. ISL-11 TaxID=2819174 RepID=UPI001BE664FE|nr:hypothetical protein [Streptomyces sp. ISL-11]MBT2385627.1 hypothetical protein [Streptomyces sp. ISL-11]